MVLGVQKSYLKKPTSGGYKLIVLWLQEGLDTQSGSEWRKEMRSRDKYILQKCIICNIEIHYCPGNTSPRSPPVWNAIDVITHPHKWDTDNESEKARSQPNQDHTHTGIILLVFYFTFLSL